jgi:hypothetical protein
MEVPKPSTGPFGGNLSNSPYVELSPTGRSIIPLADRAGNMNWVAQSEDGLGFRSRHELGRYHDLRSSNQNFVDIERIRCGADVRTTVSISLSLFYWFHLFNPSLDYASQYPKQD